MPGSVAPVRAITPSTRTPGSSVRRTAAVTAAASTGRQYGRPHRAANAAVRSSGRWSASSSIAGPGSSWIAPRKARTSARAATASGSFGHSDRPRSRRHSATACRRGPTPVRSRSCRTSIPTATTRNSPRLARANPSGSDQVNAHSHPRAIR